MEARDFRSIGRAAREELRRRALFLVERQGLSQGRAARLVGVHRQTVNTWVKRYRERGEEGVLDGRRVSPRRGKGRLTAEEADKVRAWVVEQAPDQLELPFALWTSRAVRELIERRFAERLGLTAVQAYLRRWGMTPRKPLVRARQRRPAAIQAWLERDYPAVARRAKAAGGDPLGRRDRRLRPGPSRALPGAQGPDPGRRPHRRADQAEPDRGGQQPRPDALHALRGRPERGP